MPGQFDQYAKVLKRAPDLVLSPRAGADPPVFVGRFPPANGMFRALLAPLRGLCVYLTHGMSARTMAVPADEASVYPGRIELAACCSAIYTGADDGQDMVAAVLQLLASFPFTTNGFLGPLHTVSLGQPLFPGSSMSAFLCGVVEGSERLCAGTPAAELIVSGMPISDSERAYAQERGSDALIELLEKSKVPNMFDPFRQGRSFYGRGQSGRETNDMT